MTITKAKSTDAVSSGLVAGTRSTEGAVAIGRFDIECIGADGEVKWTDSAPNLVVNAGLAYMAGSALTSVAQITTWYLGLYGAGSSNTPAAGDTMSSHAGWTENSSYAGTRPAATFGAATLADPSNINNAATTASFTFTANATIAGAFLTNVASGTSPGLLFSAADFQSPGDRTVVTGDVLNVTYSFNLDAQ